MQSQTHLLRLREYEPAVIGPEWNANRKVVSPSIVSALELLQATTRSTYLHMTRRRIVAQNFVGVIGLGERAIEILPKIDTADDGARRRLVEMLSIAGLVPHLDAGIADLASRVPSLLDAFMQAYTRQLALEWRRGRIANYRKLDENRTRLRGKLLFNEQIRRNRLRPDRFFTRADTFITDVSPSQLLKAGLDVCRRYGFADLTRRNALSLLAEFDEISDYRFTDAELDTIQVDRRIARFGPLLNLAKRFVRGQVPDQPGGAGTYSLVFDMNVVFERYISHLLRRVCLPPFSVHLQVSQRSLVLQGNRPKFRLQPDIAIRRGSRFVCLVDTKWKMLEPHHAHSGVRQSDMYQAYAYAKEYACPRVVLLYPKSGDLDPEVTSYRLRPGTHESPQVNISTIDITTPVSEVARQLVRLLSSLD